MADIHIHCEEPTSDEMEMMRDRMSAYIFPNTPRNETETAAFDKACKYQIAHEKTIASQVGDNAVPEGTKSFNIGDFAMSFEDGVMSSRLTRKTICPSAHGVLLREGLLYKGVERAW